MIFGSLESVRVSESRNAGCTLVISHGGKVLYNGRSESELASPMIAISSPREQNDLDATWTPCLSIVIRDIVL